MATKKTRKNAPATQRKPAKKSPSDTQVLQATIESSRDIIMAIDRDYRYLCFNAAHRASMRTAYGVDIAVGMNILDCITSAADQQNAQANYDRALAGDFHSTVQEYGSVERSYYESFYNPLRNGDGEVFGITAIAKDVTDRKRAEEALRLSEERLRVGLNAADVAVFSQDVDLRYVWMYQPQLGYAPEKVVGHTDAELLPSDAAQQVMELKRRVLEGGRKEHAEVAVTVGERTSVFTLVAEPVRDASGAITGLVGATADITERKRVEEALRERHARLEETQRLAQLGSWSWDAATDTGTWSEELFRIAGRDPAGPAPTYAEHPQVYTPESFARLSAAVDRALGGGEPYELDLELVRPDGTHRGVASRGEAVRDAAGRVVGLRGMLLDITERVRAEAMLRDDQERIRAILDTVGDPIFVKDNAHRITLANHAFYDLFGLDEGSVIGKTLAEHVPPDERQQFLAVDRRVLDTGIPDLREETLTVSDVTRTIVTRKTRFVEHSGKRFLVGSIHDVTDLKRAQEERERFQMRLNQAQKLESVGRLAGGIAHDFNNSLQIVLLNVEMLLASRDLSDVSRKRLLDIQESARHSSALTAQLLAFARRQVVRAQVLNLNDATEALVPTLQRLVGESIPVEWRPGAELWPVSLDPSQYQQVLVNLANNAHDAIHGNGHLTIATANVTTAMAEGGVAQSPAPGHYVRLVVTDDGPGMSGETLEHLFEPFYTTKGVGEGTGLGLASVFGVVQQNGGTIAVDSALGRGTTVTIHWPRLATAAKLPAEAPPDLAPPRGTETVLVVEDEPKILEGCVAFLEALGYTVLSATLPSEALRVAEVHDGPLQLLLTDVVMPEMSGHALAARLTVTRPTLRRLYMTGYADSVQRQAGIDEGLRLLNKPFTLDALAHAVRAALDDGQGQERASDIPA